jgi:hypothetical protein
MSRKTQNVTNDIGDTQLSAVWTDPDFDPAQRAVYYVRVLEIPTPRWSTYDAVKLGVKSPKGVPASIQERAWLIGENETLHIKIRKLVKIYDWDSLPTSLVPSVSIYSSS